MQETARAPALTSSAPRPFPAHARDFRVRRFVNWFPLGLTYATLYMGRYNYNVAKGPIGAAFHFDKAQMGIIATAGFWTYALAVLVNGPLADRVGGRRAILVGAAGSAVLNGVIGVLFLTGTTQKLILSLSLLYAVNMYFQSFGALSVVKVNAAWFHVRERGILGGVFGSMISAGYWLAYGICGWIIEKISLWAVYLIPAAVLTAMTVVDFAIVRNRPSDAGFADFETGDEAADDAHDDGDTRVPFTVAAARVLRHPVLRVLAVAEFCTGIVRQGLLLYFPEFLTEVHGIKRGSFDFQVASIGITLGGIVGALACGVISDRLFQSRRAPVAFLFYVGQAISLAVLGLARGAFFAAFMIGFSCVWIFGVHGMLSGTASMDFGGKKAAATATGLLDGVQYLGSGLTGYGLGWLLDRYHWGIWPYALIPFAVVGAALMVRLWDARPTGRAAH